MRKPTPPCEANAYYQAHVRLLMESYRRLLKRPLMDMPPGSDPAVQVFNGDFALLSHNCDPDPVFNYANRTALELFEFGWDELVGMPSRLSAEPDNQQARERLLAKAAVQGFVENYSGVRISKTGRRFQIRDAVVWNVYDESGVFHGQAACFKDWLFFS